MHDRGTGDCQPFQDPYLMVLHNYQVLRVSRSFLLHTSRLKPPSFPFPLRSGRVISFLFSLGDGSCHTIAGGDWFILLCVGSICSVFVLNSCDLLVSGARTHEQFGRFRGREL